MEINKIEAVIEAMLFASGDPVSLETLAQIIGVDKKTLGLLITRMMDNYIQHNRGIQIREINGGYQLCSKPEYFDFVKKLFEPRHKQGLSQAALESLSIIAYNQPITRADLERIRGVNSDSAVNSLIEHNLIMESGRMDAPGRPILYETSEEFLRAFGYKSLSDLPRMDDFMKLEEEASLI